MLKNPDETKERRRRMRYANDCTDMLTGSSTFQYTMRDMQKKVVSHVLSAIVISLSNITIACVCTAMWSSKTLICGICSGQSDPQLSVGDNYSYLFNLKTNMGKSLCLNAYFDHNNSDLFS